MTERMIRNLKKLSTAMVTLAAVTAFLISGVRIFGIEVFGVLTGSMEPTYPVGSLLYVRAVEPGDLQVNDVITFSISPDITATHRIVEIVPDEKTPGLVQYRTKGDANGTADASLVVAGSVIGKVFFALPGLGHWASCIQEPPGICAAILVCGLLMAFVFYTDSLGKGKKKPDETSGVETENLEL